MVWQSLTFVAALMLLAPNVALAQQPCTTDARRVVDELYRHVLERSADANSDTWVRQLESRQTTVRDVVRGLVMSSEYNQRFFRTEPGEERPYIRSVRALHRHLLGTQPDEARARAWANVAASRGLNAVVDSMIGSAEYQNAFGFWGVPGSGGLRFCGNDRAGVVPPDDRFDDQNIAPRFRNMDQNGDGVISRNEWRGTPQVFTQSDWNRDGRLSGDEIRVNRQGRPADDSTIDRVETFENLDWNNNNRIERSEWNGRADTFTWLDRNNDNVLTRAELGANRGRGAGGGPIGTTGTSVTVSALDRWMDTGITLTAGDMVVFDANGRIRMSSEGNDEASPQGSLIGRRAPEAPIPGAPAGGLIARVGNSRPFFVGDGRQVRVPTNGRLFLSVNDDYLEDNSGQYRVTVTVQGR